MLPRSGCALRQGLLGAQIVASGEVLAAGREDHYPNGVVGLGAAERLIELHQQAAALRVVSLGAVEPDAGDAALVEGFVGHQLACVGVGRLTVGLVRDCHSAYLASQACCVPRRRCYTLRPARNEFGVGLLVNPYYG